MNNVALIGSLALDYHINIGRQTKDIDLLMYPEDFDEMCSKLHKKYPVKSITYLKKWKDCVTGVVVIAADHPEDRDCIIDMLVSLAVELDTIAPDKFRGYGTENNVNNCK